jgi:hypothetical protein
MSLAILGMLVLSPALPQDSAEETLPVIYGSDLLHPFDDPDDHFDLAAIYAMPELDLKGIVLDLGQSQEKRPGRIPVSQMNRITGRDIPAATGLVQKLKSPADTGLDQKPESQGGVASILDILRKSPVPVRIATVGSVRDLVAAYNREPDLVRSKVDRILIFIGEASHPTFREWNVELDPHAYVGLMRSGLPIWWVPCFDGGVWKNQGHASFWKAKHEAVLKEAAPAVIQYFIYALEKETSDPLEFIARPADPQRQARLFAMQRNFWCTAIFGVLSGRTIAFEGGRWNSVPAKKGRLRAAPPANELFGFTEVEVSITDNAITRVGPGEGTRKVMLFEVKNREKYAEGMTAATAGLIAGLGKR